MPHDTPAQSHARPDFHSYFMQLAMAVRERANCLGSRVGAVLVKDERIVSTGYNGTPVGFANCTDGGCHRCAHREQFPSGTGYDLCICVHAEQNALLAAARFGIAVEDSTLYTTMRPCFGCTKEMLQAKVRAVYYLHDWQPTDPAQGKQYDALQRHFPTGVHALSLPDPQQAWAVARLPAHVKTEASDETGHTPG